MFPPFSGIWRKNVINECILRILRPFSVTRPPPSLKSWSKKFRHNIMYYLLSVWPDGSKFLGWKFSHYGQHLGYFGEKICAWGQFYHFILLTSFQLRSHEIWFITIRIYGWIFIWISDFILLQYLSLEINF